MKKELSDTKYLVYNKQLQRVTLQIPGYGAKSEFNSIEETENALIENEDELYRQGDFIILPFKTLNIRPE